MGKFAENSNLGKRVLPRCGTVLVLNGQITHYFDFLELY